MIYERPHFTPIFSCSVATLSLLRVLFSTTGGSTGSSQGTRRTFAAKFSSGKVGKSVVSFQVV